MAVRLSKMKGKVKEASLQWDDETVAFAYKPNEFTLELAERISSEAEAENLGMVAELLGPIVEWWDVLDEDDQRIPATAENMKTFPLQFLVRLMGAITEAQEPGGSKDSAAG